MLHLVDRRIVCTCEACWALRSGDAEYRPTGMRELWLTDFRCDEETWAGFQIPIGLAFFMRSTVTDSVVAFYPSPAGATESELALERLGARWSPPTRCSSSWTPTPRRSSSTASTEPPEYAILPIDRCYELVGLIKSRWEGISGGSAIERAVPEFFDADPRRAVVAS